MDPDGLYVLSGRNGRSRASGPPFTGACGCLAWYRGGARSTVLPPAAVTATEAALVAHVLAASQAEVSKPITSGKLPFRGQPGVEPVGARSPGRVSVPEHYLRRCVEMLRRDGSVVVRMAATAEGQEWRAGIRRLCRAAGLRVRTGLSGDGEVAWAYHVDHVVTEASWRAARRAAETAFSGEFPSAPFHDLVREEQRKMLRLVHGQPGQD